QAEKEPKKLSGVLVNSFSEQSDDAKTTATLLLGVGINVYDCPWTRSLNDHLLSLSSSSSQGAADHPPRTTERLLACFCNNVTLLFKDFVATGGFRYERYYSCWMRSGQRLFVDDERCWGETAGIARHGFLLVKPCRDTETAGSKSPELMT